MRVPKSVRNGAIGVVVLLVLLVGGGIAYTYYFGPEGGTAAAPAPAVVKTETTPLKPTAPTANAKEGAAVQSVTSPVVPGSNVILTVRTNATSKCTIVVAYNNVPSKDSGLVPKTADQYGMVTWSWTVESTVPLGKWPATITCVYNGRSAVVVADIEVSKTP